MGHRSVCERSGVPFLTSGEAKKDTARSGVLFFAYDTVRISAAALAVLAILFQFAHDGFRVDALTAVVVGQSSLDSLLSQNRAVHLDRGQTLQSFHNGLVGQLQCLVHGLALDQVGGHAAGGNGGTAAKGQELDINDHVVLDLQVHAHDIAALGVAHFTHAVCIGDLADIVRVCEMLHDLCAIHTCHLSFLPSG